MLRQIANEARAPHADPSKDLMIIDARPRTNAEFNRGKGGGYENTSAGGGYSTCDFVFLNIENIHVMRNSLEALSVADDRVRRTIIMLNEPVRIAGFLEELLQHQQSSTGDTCLHWAARA